VNCWTSDGSLGSRCGGALVSTSGCPPPLQTLRLAETEASQKSSSPSSDAGRNGIASGVICSITDTISSPAGPGASSWTGVRRAFIARRARAGGAGGLLDVHPHGGSFEPAARGPQDQSAGATPPSWPSAIRRVGSDRGLRFYDQTGPSSAVPVTSRLSESNPGQDLQALLGQLARVIPPMPPFARHAAGSRPQPGIAGRPRGRPFLIGLLPARRRWMLQPPKARTRAALRSRWPPARLAYRPLSAQLSVSL